MTTQHKVEQIGQEIAALRRAEGMAQTDRDLSIYRGRIVAFCREVLGWTPYDAQAAFLETATRDRYVVARGAHGMGKDAALAALALYDCFVERRLVLIISATARQLLGQVFTELRRMHRLAKLPGTLLSDQVELDGERRIIAMTSGSTSNLTGWHDANGVAVLISEAQGEAVEAAAYDAILGNVTDSKSHAVVGGNPVRPRGRFYELHRTKGWTQVHLPASAHPNISEGWEVIPGGPTPEWVEDVAQQYGRDSAYYMGRVLGEFPTEGSADQLIRRDWLEAAYARAAEGYLAAKALNTNVPITLGVDPALTGDETAVAVSRGPVLLEVHTWRDRDLRVTTERIVAHGQRLAPLGDYRPTAYVDEIGLGHGVVALLRDRKWPVEGVNVARAARNPQRFANVRAELYWTLRDLLERGRVAMPRDAQLEEELLAIEWQADAQGRLVIVPKDALRSTLGRSPDRADAVAIALAYSAGGLGGRWREVRALY